MNRFIKALLVIAAICVPVGIIFLGVGFVMGGKGIIIDDNFNVLTEREVYTYEKDGLKEFDSMDIDVKNAKVVVKKSRDDSYGIKVSLEKFGNEEPRIEVKGNCLYVKEAEKKGMFFSFGLGSIGNNTYVEVYIPAKEYEDMHIKSSNGSITVEGDEGVSFANTSLKSSNGAVSISEIKNTGSMYVKTSNGSITVRDSEFKGGEFKTSNGKITSIDNTFAKDADFKTSNGSIEFETDGGVDAYRFDAKTSNGSIRVNGDKKGKDCEWGTGFIDITVKTSNGSINIECEE